MDYSIFFCVSALFLIIFFGLFKCIRHARFDGYLNFINLTRISFIVFYPISGISHYLYADNYYRGFFDVYSMRDDHIFVTLVTCFVAVLLFYLQDYFFQKWSNSSAPAIHRDGSHSLLLPTYGLIFIIAGFFASTIISSSIDVSVIDRGREIPGGLAKFIFISLWLGWGLTYISFYLIGNKRVSNFWAAIILFISIFLIFSNAVWMGGRSVVVLLSFPILFVYSRFRRRVFNFSIPLLIVGFFIYAMAVTQVRKEGYAVESTSISQVLDWEVGRFSMIGYAIDFVDRANYYFGYSYFDMLAKLVMSPFYFLGFGADFVGSPSGSTVALIGADLFGVGVTYIVPGAFPEAYINLGIFGVALIVFFVAYLSAYVDRMLHLCNFNPFGFVFWVYIGTLLCLNFLNSTISAFANYIFFTGFPIALGYFLYGRSNHRV